VLEVSKLDELRSYFTLIHHTKGRLRLRISSKIKSEKQNLKLEDVDSYVLKIKGIKSLKINKLIGSLTIEYDNDIFPKNLWDDLLEGKNLEKICQIINKVIKELE